MRVFVTGATGFVGTAVVKDLLSRGHQVLGLARSEESAKKLEAAGVEVFRGSLDDPAGLKKAAMETDGVIHTAFIHDFSDMATSGRKDYAAIQAMGEALEGSNKPLIITSGIGLLKKTTEFSTESDAPNRESAGAYRVPSEDLALELAIKGIRSAIVRLPPSVHGEGDYGFVPTLMNISKEKGSAAYIGDGSNRWPAVYLHDAAHLFVLVLENGSAGKRYHAVGETGVPMIEIATAIGKRLDVPVTSKTPAEAKDFFGWISHFAGIDVPATAELTKAGLGWKPVGRKLVEDIERY